MTLDQIGLKYGTDKASTGHNYCKIYDRYLSPKRVNPVVLLEVGIGGEEHIDRGGQSLRMWREYFTNPRAKIIGIDLYKKRLALPAGVTIYQGSQDDPEFLTWIMGKEGTPDIIVDDASHHNARTIKTFELLFREWLKKDGLYICEDIHTSYWTEFYDGHPDPATLTTTMSFFQRLTHQLNYYTLLEEHRDAYAGYLEYVHFYPEMAIIKKNP